MEVSRTLGITSGVITAGLIIAWGITTGVVRGTATGDAKRTAERNAILQPILPRKDFIKVQINDSVAQGRLDSETADLLKKAVDSTQVSENYRNFDFGKKAKDSLVLKK